MLFNSIDFLFFFPFVVLIYFLIPKRGRIFWLLIASYYFYMSWNAKYAVLIGASTMLTYVGGGILGWLSGHGQKMDAVSRKAVVWICLLASLGLLAVFKYGNFAIETLNLVFSKVPIVSIQAIEHRFDVLLPVGISFYTFQTLGYVIDVYRGTVKAEKNMIRYALFVSFFPQLVAGPIERSKNLLEQIQRSQETHLWDFERVRDGLLLLAYGLFQKLVVADRASILVHQVYGSYQDYGFIELAIASILFAFQIYCDFGGYTNIARGAAKVMGFSLMDNFRQPYLAVNIKEFWRRWHISLTSWFTDYLYIPFGGSRKGKLRKYLNIVVVFAVSGLWHGASWHFVAWGLVHAVFQIAGDIKSGIEKKYGWNDTQPGFSKRLRKRLATFLLVDFAWVFFAADSISHAIGIFRQMFRGIITSSLYGLGLDRGNWKVLAIAIILIMAVDTLHEHGRPVTESIMKQEIWFRCAVYAALVWSILLLGIYGVQYDAGQFIYFQF